LPLPAHTVRFGPFELDLSTAELRNNGATSKLAEQPFQILAELVQHPGEVVTRDELRQRLWHSDTFVDFEYGLNAAVKRLREVLGDSADSPRYIETIPRRGYRFIAAVTEAPLPAGLEAKKNNLWKVAVPAAVLLLAALIAGWLFYPWRQVRTLTDKDTIVLADIDNKTGNPVFDDTLKQGLSVQLEQSPFLALVSERRVNETLKLMGRPAGDRLTPEVTREVCQRTGSKAMLTGSIAGLGNQYVIGLKAVNCNTGDTLAELQEQAAGKEAVLKALDAAAVSMRSKLGESLSSVEKYATPLEEATTPSLEALKAYSLGRKTEYAKGGTAALPFFKRAVELDPNFAMAQVLMSVVHSDFNEAGRAAECARRAYELREKVSERERFKIDSRYYDAVTGELEKVVQNGELWQQTYPRDGESYKRLGLTYAKLGNWEKALEENREVLRLEASDQCAVCTYVNLGVDYMSLNRLDEAEEVFNQAEERMVEGEFLLQGSYWLAFLRGDTARMAQLVSAAMASRVRKNCCWQRKRTRKVGTAS